jgi:type III restriction enzyme
LEQLVHNKYRLKQSVAQKIEGYIIASQNNAYQMFLDIESETPLVVSEEVSFSYSPRQYPYSTSYRGRYEFKKHYYKEIGDLNGEEEECAQYLDKLEEVEYWVRNLERRRNDSFSLLTATDRFYPDFVVKLKDGRTLVVEYKGEHLWGSPDSTEKKNLGELWAKRSGDKCLFVMPKGKDWRAIESVVHS